MKPWGLGWSPAQTLQELARGAAAGEEGKTWYFGIHLMEQAEVPPIFSNQAAGTYFSPHWEKNLQQTSVHTSPINSLNKTATFWHPPAPCHTRNTRSLGF